MSRLPRRLDLEALAARPRLEAVELVHTLLMGSDLFTLRSSERPSDTQR